MEPYKSLIKKSALFRELSDIELDRMACLCHEEVFDAGTVLYNEGDLAENLYLVDYGRIALNVTLHLGPGQGRTGTVDVVTKGQAFCCSAICEVQTCIATARCIEKTALLVFNGKDLSSFFKEYPHAGYQVMQKIAGTLRIRFLNIQYTLAHILSICAHDLRSPLAAVESYNHVLIDGYAGEINEKQKNMLLRSTERIQGLLNLINNILDISRVDSGELEKETLSLLDIANNSMDNIRPLAAQKQIKINLNLPDKLPEVDGCAIRLEQVFTNLLGNAIKFTDEGGTITLEIDEEANRITTMVKDTGIGISAEELPWIFDDFYRGIRVNSDGVGLGLPISKKIIEAHKGKIWAVSPCPENGMGSKFIFTLPKKEGDINN